MIRQGKFGDIPRITDMIVEAQAKSCYADICGVDVKATKAFLVNALQRHGHKQDGGMLVLVSERDEQVEGFIIGALQPIYLVCDKLQVSDVFWIATKKVNPRDPARLLDKLLKWARSCPDVVDEQFAVSGVINQDWQRTGKILERRGFRLHGNIYRKDAGS